MCQVTTKASIGQNIPPPMKMFVESGSISRWRRTTILFIVVVVASIASFLAGTIVRQTWLSKSLSSFDDLAYESEKSQLDGVVVDDIVTSSVEAEIQKFTWKIEDGDDEEDEDDEDDSSSDDDEEFHYHLRMSLKNLSHDLIESESAIYQLMKKIEDEFDLELVAHGCQEVPLRGDTAIRCFGILDSGGRISFYAWPNSSALLFDLITDEEVDIDDVNLLSDVFKQQRNEESYATNAVHGNDFPFGLDSTWSIRQRGIHEETSDYELTIEDSGDLKKQIASIQSPFQKIDIVDLYESRDVAKLYDGLQKDPEYVLNNPKLFQPDRTLFLDGVTQSARAGNAAYHESLVQPALFSHPNPTRVAIIGGGECATLREVLKHNTIEKVIMIDIDEVIVEASKQYLPDWNDCSNFEGSSRYCMDDPRADVFAEDAFKWFIDRFGENPIEEEPLFDVIVLDALDPQNVVDFAAALYGDSSFLGSLYNGLAEDGILVSQVGETVKIRDPAQTYSINRNRALFVNSMMDQGFVSIVEYDEANAQFEAPWTFNAMFKSLVSRHNWDDNEPMVNLKIKKRAIRTLDGESPFEYFDGADMQRRLPSKASEVVFCRQEPTPPGCIAGHGFDPSKPNIRRANNGTDIHHPGPDLSAGFYMMLEDAVHHVSFQENTKRLISNSGRHDVFSKSSLSRLDAFQKAHSYKSSDFDGTYKIHTDLACNNEAHVAGFRRNATTTDRDYVYNPAFERNSHLQNDVLDLKNPDLIMLNATCALSSSMLAMVDPRTIS